MSVEGEWRQMSFSELQPENGGEAPKVRPSDESSTATHDDRASGTAGLLEQAFTRLNLLSALERVVKNGGGPGIDGMKVKELRPWLKTNWLKVKASLLDGTYEPSPVLRHAIPKPGGGVRELGIPTVLDRYIQQLLLQVLQPIFDPTFSDHSFGFRPGRSAHDAVRRAQSYIAEGRHIVVDVDLERFFDLVNHDVLMGRLEKRIEDRRVLRLIRRFLVSDVMANGVLTKRTMGTPQGGPLSPLLANVLLDEVDKELERRGHAFVRYADDGLVFLRSEKAAKRVMAFLGDSYGRLQLRINEDKSAIRSAFDCTFLGFNFWMHKGDVKLGPAKKTLKRLRDRVREKTRSSRGWKMESVVHDLRIYLLGWRNYFDIADTPGIFARLDKWIRRRLRALQLRQWKRGTTAFRELRNRGASIPLAAGVAAHLRRWWWNAKHSVNRVLTNASFDEMGVPRLAE